MTICNKCSINYDYTEAEQEFCQNYDLPLPSICPECRLIRRLQERNARKLYYRKCDFSGKRIISMYHENQPFPVYDQAIWWSDEWNAKDFGQDFDFSRPFFEQFLELKNKVPHFSVFIVGGTLENSEFTNCTGYLKNCYLISESDYDEDCLYSNRIYHSKNLIDCTNCYQCEFSYECIDCNNCYNLKYSQNCENCSDSAFLQNCISCKNCIGCINQRHKEYMIYNQQYTKTEYESILKQFNLDTHQGVQKISQDIKDFFKQQPRKATEGEHNENTLGNFVFNSKNAYQCFDCKDLEDCTYCVKVAGDVKNCIDYTAWGFKAELIYNSAGCGDNAYNLKFCSTCTTNISNLEYCYQCSSSQNLFGCVGIRNSKFCILNKQYSEQEYYDLRKKIIEHMKQTGEWGQYFPIESCGFGYNETIAMDHFPLTKEQALSQGYHWSDYEHPAPEVSNIIQANQVPESITQISDEYLNWAIICESTNKPFKLTPTELKFYRQLNIPCPKRRPDQRHADRMAKRPPYKLKNSSCYKCQIQIMCPTNTSDQDKLLCNNCYTNLVN